MDYSKYPKNWKQISQQIRFERADGMCEWCGVEHLAVGARDIHDRWHDESDIETMSSDIGDSLFGGDYPKIIKIILTTAHLGVDKPDGTKGDKRDKMDCRPDNLASLCQRCHLNYDRDEHAENRKRTLYQKKHEQHQTEGNQLLPLFDAIVSD